MGPYELVERDFFELNVGVLSWFWYFAWKKHTQT